MLHTTTRHARNHELLNLATAALMSAFVLASCGATVVLCRYAAHYLLTRASLPF